jgi:hypothetical protein
MKSVTVMLIFFLPLLCKGQMTEVKKLPEPVKIGEVKRAGSFVVNLSYRVEGSDTTYTLMYRDQQYSSLIEIESVTFSGIDNTLDKLYRVFKSVFSDENKRNGEYKVQFRLGGEDVIVSNYIAAGKPSAFFHADGYFALWEKEVDKLFGK